MTRTRTSVVVFVFIIRVVFPNNAESARLAFTFSEPHPGIMLMAMPVWLGDLNGVARPWSSTKLRGTFAELILILLVLWRERTRIDASDEAFATHDGLEHLLVPHINADLALQRHPDRGPFRKERAHQRRGQSRFAVDVIIRVALRLSQRLFLL